MVRRRSWVHGAYCLWLLALLGCQAVEPATEVLVVVHSDLQAQLSEVRGQVFDSAGRTQVSETHRFQVATKPTSGRVTIPFSYSLYPIDDATRFREDLEADSLDLYTLVQELEDSYGVKMSDEQAAQILSVGQAVDFVLAHAPSAT